MKRTNKRKLVRNRPGLPKSRPVASPTLAPRSPGASGFAVEYSVQDAIQYTVRSVPARVDEALRRRAGELGLSLNEILRRALIREAGLGDARRELHRELDHLAGTWVEDPVFDAVLAEQDRVDESLWK